MLNWWAPYWGSLPLDLSRLKAKQLAKLENNFEFMNLFETYFTLAMDQFGWDGLPDTCDERFLERAFLLCGKAMIAEYKGSYLSLAAANGADLNVYGYSLKGWGWGMNGFNEEFNLFVPGADGSRALHEAASGLTSYPKPNAVIGYDNTDQYPTVNYIISAAKRLADLLRSCDVAVQNMKSPYLIACDEQQVSSVKKALEQRDQNMAAIIGSKMSLSADMFKVFPTNTEPEVLKTFWEQFRNIEANLLTTLGVNANDNTDKKERLLVDEVNANNELANSNLAKRLKQREIFADRVNMVFGLSIKPYLRKNDFEEEGITDAELYTDPGSPGADGLAEGTYRE